MARLSLPLAALVRLASVTVPLQASGQATAASSTSAGPVAINPFYITPPASLTTGN